MARDVYAWPPVDAIATMWSVSQPVNRSMSFFTGADISSSGERKRKIASVDVPGVGDIAGSMNGGYCEVLKDLLAGGMNFVRLNSMPVNWYFDEASVTAAAGLIEPPMTVNWTEGGSDVTWTTGPTDTVWISNPNLSGVKGTDGNFYTVTLTGFPPNTLIARPGEYVRGYSLADLAGGSGTTAKVLRPAYSDASGSVVIYLMSELTDVFHVEINARESAVFRIDGDLPNGVQPVNGNWSYVWNFKEVFADEVDGGFTEIDPWT